MRRFTECGGFVPALQRRPRKSTARAQSYGANAREALAAFPDSAIKRELIEVIDFCVERAY